MPKHHDFRRFGIFTIERFLEPELCARLRTEVLAANQLMARVTGPSGDLVVDEAHRRTKTACVSGEAIALIRQRVDAIKGDLEAHFRTSVREGTDPSFLVYRPGDFFNYHEDVRDTPEQPEEIRDREISIVIFLNGEGNPGAAGDAKSTYGGGQLKLYRLMNFPNSAAYGMPLVGEEGLLVAFRSNLPHEVTEVVHGDRCTVVYWLLRDRARGAAPVPSVTLLERPRESEFGPIAPAPGAVG